MPLYTLVQCVKVCTLRVLDCPVNVSLGQVLGKIMGLVLHNHFSLIPPIRYWLIRRKVCPPLGIPAPFQNTLLSFMSV